MSSVIVSFNQLAIITKSALFVGPKGSVPTVGENLYAESAGDQVFVNMIAENIHVRSAGEQVFANTIE